MVKIEETQKQGKTKGTYRRTRACRTIYEEGVEVSQNFIVYLKKKTFSLTNRNLLNLGELG